MLPASDTSRGLKLCTKGRLEEEVGVPVKLLLDLIRVLGIDRVLDMARTAVNVAGDLACAVVVSAAEPPVEKGPPA